MNFREDKYFHTSSKYLGISIVVRVWFGIYGVRYVP